MRGTRAHRRSSPCCRRRCSLSALPRRRWRVRSLAPALRRRRARSAVALALLGHPLLTPRARAQALAVPDWTPLSSVDAGASLPPAGFAVEALRRVRRARRRVLPPSLSGRRATDLMMRDRAMLDEVTADIKAVNAGLEKVEAEIQQARAEHNAEEVAALRKKEEQLRKKEEQLRTKKLLLLQRQPGARCCVRQRWCAQRLKVRSTLQFLRSDRLRLFQRPACRRMHWSG